MINIFAFETVDEYKKYEETIKRFNKKLEKYIDLLQKDYVLTELPKGIVWTTKELATTAFSTIPIPAFTNKDLIYITPSLEEWRSLFIKQLDDKELPEVRDFYENMSENHVLTIVGHEFTHHSDLFLDDFDDVREDSIWFEEGMCQYLPRKMMLSEAEFEEITNVEKELVKAFEADYGSKSLDHFGSASYQGSLSSMLFDYWRSFLAIKYLVEERTNLCVNKVFEQYHQWDKDGRKVPLTEFFQITKEVWK